MARAREHVKSVEDALGDFRQRNPISRISEVDPQTGEKIWRVDKEPARPPLTLHPLIGDALYNFRSALDHLAWELVVRAGGTPDRETAFPLFNDEGLYARFAPAKVDGMSPEMIAAVKDCQPCFGRNPYRNRVLWALETFGNIDKHRHFNITYASTMGGFWSEPLPMRETRWFIHSGPIERGTILARLPSEYMQVEFAPALDVAFGEGILTDHEASVFGALIGFRELLTRIIQDFVNEFFR